MKCKVCGNESGKYPLCRACNEKKDKGEIIKCAKCNSWHYVNASCPIQGKVSNSDTYLYDAKKNLMSKSEQIYYNAIKTVVPENFCVFPQINLASFINRTDNSRFHNELFRNVDFLITNANYEPKVVVEINDQTHLNNERKERDEKVRNICEEAGIPIIKLWTSYGVNNEYIKKRIDDVLFGTPVARVHHFDQAQPQPPIDSVHQIDQTQSQTPVVFYQPSETIAPSPKKKKKKGCYVATCVYGKYDCPEVWVLRRFRDYKLAKNIFGRIFIRLYYSVSPVIVKYFGKTKWFNNIFRSLLDIMVTRLQINGFENTPYNDDNQ